MRIFDFEKLLAQMHPGWASPYYHTSLYLRGKGRLLFEKHIWSSAQVKIGFCNIGKTSIEFISLDSGVDSEFNSIKDLQVMNVMNSMCLYMLFTDRYRWSISKIKTILSTNKIPLVNFQFLSLNVLTVFAFFFFFEKSLK